jgi:hypothetical protein
MQRLAAQRPGPSEGPAILAALAQGELSVFAPGAERSRLLHFSFEGVPVSVHLRRRGGRGFAAITGELATLPFTAESAERQRRLGMILAAAQRDSAWHWGITPRREMRVTTEIELLRPNSPTGIIAEVIAALFGIREHLALLVQSAG